jgi:alpha-galactosidase
MRIFPSRVLANVPAVPEGGVSLPGGTKSVMRRVLRVAAALLVSVPCFVRAAEPSAALTPPMGWNSWNHFAEHVTDADIRAAADALVRTGMRDAGYVYVNVDDTWQGKRDAKGVLHANERFPDMKSLADYIHSKGLKFGIYSSPGAKTCAGFAGSLGHETQDAQLYAAWGVDFLKYDLCSFQTEMDKARAAYPNDAQAAKNLMIAAYKKMGDALKATGRPIIYSLCQYGVDQPWKWGPSVGASMWRTTDDIDDSYGRMIAIGFAQEGLEKFAGPGTWNDPDMLEIGNGKMSPDEYRTHMSLWALLAAPLLAGNDLSKMSASDQHILMNADAVAIDQDALGRQGSRLHQSGDQDVWTRPLSGGRVAVGLFNRAWGPREVSFDLAEIGFGNGAAVRDVWKEKDLGRHSGVFTASPPKHGVTLLIVSP